MNIIYSIIMLALVGLALTAQTAFATNGNESKGNATGNLSDPPNNNQNFNGLTGDPKHGSVWNHGYAVGYYGYDLKGAHENILLGLCEWFYGLLV